MNHQIHWFALMFFPFHNDKLFYNNNNNRTLSYSVDEDWQWIAESHSSSVMYFGTTAHVCVLQITVGVGCLSESKVQWVKNLTKSEFINWLEVLLLCSSIFVITETLWKIILSTLEFSESSKLSPDDLLFYFWVILVYW